MKYSLTSHEFDETDKLNINKLLDSTKLTMGSNNKDFEKRLSSFFGTKYALTCNSGSSANLLIIASLFYSGLLSQGDEILVPSVSWSTTFSPLSQFNMKLKFVDVDLDTYNLSIDILKKSITKKTKAIIFVSLLGNSLGLPEIYDYCKKNNIILLEDNCESFGTKIMDQYSGSFGLLSSLSFYYSHQLPTVEGGAVLTDSRELYDTLLCLRSHGWTRELNDDTHLHVEQDKFKRKFRFTLPGYNLRMMEISSVFGLRRLDLWNETFKRRYNNYLKFSNLFSDSKIMKIQKVCDNASLFGFGAVLSPEINRLDFYDYLESNNIETRPIVAGNFVKNKALDYMSFDDPGDLKNSDTIDNRGIFFGNCNKNLSDELNYLKEKIDAYEKSI